METFFHDLRYGFRMLLKRRGFTAMAVVALILGIGANTAIFSVIDAVILRPLPYPESERLVRIWESNPGRGWSDFAVSEPNYYDWAQQNEVFEHLAAQQSTTFNLTGDGDPERIIGAFVTANFFPTLGVSPASGRNFLSEEDRPGGQKVVIVSHSLWQQRFGSQPDLVGKPLRLSGENYTVVGILPKSFNFLSGTELWVPIARNMAQADRSNHILRVLGRLKTNITFEQARANMETIARRLEQQYPASNAGWGVLTRTFYDWIVPEEIRRALLVLQAAVIFVLLIACANVANLLLAQATTRQREVAIRRALGASRTRIVRQLLTESTIIALLGGAGGILLAMWATELLAAGNTVLAIPRLNEVRLDGRVLGFTLSLSLLTGLIFGLMPALQLSKPDINSTLKEGMRGLGGGARRRLLSVLVVSETALVLVLLVGAGLMVRSFLRLQKVPLGFEPENVLTMRINLPSSKYGEREQIVDFFNQLLERLRTVPGALNAAAISDTPFSGGNWAMEVTLEGSAADKPQSADVRAVTPNYFRTMGIPLLKGRDFTEQDRGDAPLTLIVSEAFARSIWPNEDPLGKRFRAGTGNPFGTVVGVVGNVRNISLENEPRPAFYFSHGHVGMNRLAIVVRTVANPDALVSALRAQVLALDPDLPVYNISTMQESVSNAAGQPRFYTILLGIFGLLALVLASIGIYGVISYSVTQRTQEIGIRIALGAQPRDVLKLIIGQGLVLAIAGVSIGLAAALALTRLMSDMLYGVKATDPLTFVMITLLLTGVALLACYIPARRAMKVDPMVALRYE